jgi:hypothetical protein
MMSIPVRSSDLSRRNVCAMVHRMFGAGKHLIEAKRTAAEIELILVPSDFLLQSGINRAV